MKDIVKVCVVQMDVEADLFEPDCKENNLTKAEKYVSENKDADIIVFPDDFFGGYGYGVMNMPDFKMRGTYEQIQEWAKKYDIFIAGSSLVPPEKPQGYKSYGQGFLISNSGEVVGIQDRIHIHDREKEWVIPGTEIKAFDTDLGRMGFSLGLDNYYPEVYRLLGIDGAEIIISLQLTMQWVDGLHETDYSHEFIDLANVYKTCVLAGAIENHVFILGSSALGTYAHADQFNCIGNSLIAYPNGRLTELDNENEGVLRAELKQKDLETVRNYFKLMKKRNGAVLSIA